MRVLHLTTVHPRRDTRVFYRECISLQKAAYQVTLLVADGKGDEHISGVHVVDIGKEKSRTRNFFKGYSKIKKVCKTLNPDIVHFHDPELIFVGRKLSKMGIPIVFDIHENIAVQILNKPYIPKFLRRPVSYMYRTIEYLIIKGFHLVLAENSYEKVYRHKGKSVTTILNTPDIDHFKEYINLDRKGNEIFYIGGISNERGLDVTLSALRILRNRNVDFFMNYIGPISKEKLASLDVSIISHNIKFYGRMDSKKGFEISKKCIVGLSVLKPIKNYVESYSTKIFEYMAIGLPVITSNFDLYKNVVEKYNCGFCVEPTSPEVLADRIEELLNNYNLVEKMGKNGVKTVAEKFNWASENQKLVTLYNRILE